MTIRIAWIESRRLTAPSTLSTLFQDLMFTTVTVVSQVMEGRLMAISTTVSVFVREKLSPTSICTQAGWLTRRYFTRVPGVSWGRLGDQGVVAIRQDTRHTIKAPNLASCPVLREWLLKTRIIWL